MKQKESFSNDIQDKLFRHKTSFFVRLAIFGFIDILILIYFISPFSKVNGFSLEGNYYYEKNEVLQILGLNNNTYLFDVDKKHCEELIIKHPLFDESCKIKITPFNLSLSLEEIALTYKDKNNNVYLSNDALLDDNLKNNLLVNEKIKLEMNNIPILLLDNTKYEVNNLLKKLSLAICGYYNAKIDYLDYRLSSEGINGDFYLYFPINDIIKEKYFNGKDGNFAFVIDASSVKFYLNKNETLKDLAKYIIKFYHDLNDDVITRVNIEKATLKEEKILDNDLSIRYFRLKYSYENKKITILALE